MNRTKKVSNMLDRQPPNKIRQTHNVVGSASSVGVHFLRENGEGEGGWRGGRWGKFLAEDISTNNL